MGEIRVRFCISLQEGVSSIGWESDLLLPHIT